MPEEPDQQSFINRFKNLFLKRDTKEIAGSEPQDEQIKEIIENVIKMSLNKLLKIILSFFSIPIAADLSKKFISRTNM